MRDMLRYFMLNVCVVFLSSMLVVFGTYSILLLIYWLLFGVAFGAALCCTFTLFVYGGGFCCFLFVCVAELLFILHYYYYICIVINIISIR